MSETLRCDHCAGHSPADSRFCIECGAALSRAATGATTRLPALALPEPQQQIHPRPAPSPFVPLRPLPARALPPARPVHPAGPDLGVPMLIIGLALAFVLVPRLGPVALVWIGLGGLLLRGLLARPGRIMPGALLIGLATIMVLGAKAIWPVILLLIGLRVVTGPHW